VARFGMDVTEFPQLLVTKPDWNLRERVLTDEYAPVNLLNN